MWLGYDDSGLAVPSQTVFGSIGIVLKHVQKPIHVGDGVRYRGGTDDHAAYHKAWDDWDEAQAMQDKEF